MLDTDKKLRDLWEMVDDLRSYYAGEQNFGAVMLMRDIRDKIDDYLHRRHVAQEAETKVDRK